MIRPAVRHCSPITTSTSKGPQSRAKPRPTAPMQNSRLTNRVNNAAHSPRAAYSRDAWGKKTWLTDWEMTCSGRPTSRKAKPKKPAMAAPKNEFMNTTGSCAPRVLTACAGKRKHGDR